MAIKTLEELNREYLFAEFLSKLSSGYLNELPSEPVKPAPKPEPDPLAPLPAPLPEHPYRPLTKPLPEPPADNRTQESQNHSTERSFLREFESLAIKIAAIAGAVLLIFTVIYGLHYNVEPGMNPAVKDGDLIMYYRWDKRYKSGDLILVNFQGQKQVRRVIATAGDTVDITEEGLVINGAPQQEPGISQKTERYEDGIDFPVTIGENKVFVLGDARENATDSRIYGPVDIGDTQGKVITEFRRRNLSKNLQVSFRKTGCIYKDFDK